MNIPVGTWLIYRFSIEGSYLQNIARPATVVCDTQQYWITDAEAWDVRTFAIDKDLRIRHLDYRGHVDDPIAYFHAVAERTYGDVIVVHHRIEVSAGVSMDSLRDQISEAGLHPNVEWTALDFPLWLPENAEYSSKSDE